MLAQALGTPFDLSQPAAQILVIVLFLVPGLNCTWTIERLAGRATLSSTERLLRAVGWSVLIYAAASPWLVRVGAPFASGRTPVWELILGGVFLVFAAPLLLALLMLLARRDHRARAIMQRLTRIHPAPTPWDFAFGEGRPCFVRIELQDGRLIGGYFGDRSFASAYPEPEDLFLEEAWGLSPDGSFEAILPESLGMLVSRDEIRVLELLTPTSEEETDAEQG
jgi:hypothetical protein